MELFAAALGELVASTGMSVGELSERAAVARSSLYAAIGGRRVPSRRFLDLLVWEIEVQSRLPEFEALRAIEQLIELQARARGGLPQPNPPAPPVRVGVLPQQRVLAEAFTAFLADLARQGVDVSRLPGAMPRWLDRYAAGKNIPSFKALADLSIFLDRLGVEQPVAPLYRLATAARKARADERRWARVLAGGSP